MIKKDTGYFIKEIENIFHVFPYVIEKQNVIKMVRPLVRPLVKLKSFKAYNQVYDVQLFQTIEIAFQGPLKTATLEI